MVILYSVKIMRVVETEFEVRVNLSDSVNLIQLQKEQCTLILRVMMPFDYDASSD